MELFKLPPCSKQLIDPGPRWNGSKRFGTYWKESNYVLLDKSDKALLDLLDILTSKTNKVIKENSKVFITNECSFPSSLLSQLNVKVKRTTLIDKADYVVVDELENESLYDSKGVLYKDGDCVYRTLEGISNESWNDIHKSWETNPNVTNKDNLYYCLSFQGFKNLKNYYTDYSDKFITTKDFVKNIYSTISKPTETEFSSITSLIESGSINNLKLALKTINFYNIDSLEPFIINSLINHFRKKRYKECNLSQFSSIEKFLFYRINHSPKDICRKYRYDVHLNLLQYIEDFNINLSLEAKRKLFPIYDIYEHLDGAGCDGYLNLTGATCKFIPIEEYKESVPDKDTRIEMIKNNLINLIGVRFNKWLVFLEMRPEITI